MYKKIVAGTDLSPTARIATDRAASLAQKLGAELVLVHAGTDPGQELDELAGSYGAKKVVEAGNPAEVLITEVGRAGADLLVVGSVGMSGARRFLLGSVPNKVSHHASTDVLIVKTDLDDLVLDNLVGDVLPLSKVSYRILAVSSADPMVWTP